MANVQQGQHELLLILDFGGQYKELIARRVRECGVLSIVRAGDISAAAVREMAPIGIILTGGPNSVYCADSPHCDKKLPYILITTQNTSNVTLEAARQLGADFIITKYERDYSAQKPVELLRMMRNAIQKHSSPDTTVPTLTPAEQNRKLTIRIHRELDAVGISPKAIGYEYLTEAIIIATKEAVPNLPKLIADNHHGKTPASIERAMQNAINKAWSNGNPEDLARNYTAVINYERGVPTLTEFIYHYANKFRNEL